MKYKTLNNCPYCDAERGVATAWGMSPEGYANLKEKHDNNHPENQEDLGTYQQHIQDEDWGGQ